MTIQTHVLRVNDNPLHHIEVLPSSLQKGTLIFFHGQGDYIDRYPPILQPFVKKGYRCLLTDLPGHGRSPGRRGHVPRIPFVNSLFETLLEKTNDHPTFIAGHSMGGLLALNFLLQNPNQFQAAWFSSPLLDPMHQAKPWMRLLLPSLSKLFPWVTVSTGVKASHCGENETENRSNSPQALYHSRISIGWGNDLRHLAESVRSRFLHLPKTTPILFTQGTLDPICPPHILSSRLQKLPPNQVSHHEIPDALHEPFTEPTAQNLQSILTSWIPKIP